jgi:hypothetical protein
MKRSAKQRHLLALCKLLKNIESFGDPGAIRTRDPQIRNLMLYPAELRGLDAVD